MIKLFKFFTLVSLIVQPTFSSTTSADYDPSNNPYSLSGAYYNSNWNLSSATPKSACDDNNWDSQCICERQKVKIDLVKNHGQALDQFSWSKIQSKHIVMIGDAHGVSNPDNILKLISHSRSDTAKQCVLLEMSSDYTSDQFIKLLSEKTGIPETDHLRKYYGRIANGATAMGFKLFNIDDPKNWSDSPPSDFDREIHMSAVINKLFKDNSCDHAVLVVGKAHIASPFAKGETLVDRLVKSNLTSVRLNPINAPNNGRKDSVETWNGLCLSQTYNPPHAIIFENTGIENDLVIPGFFPPLSNMKYRDFDYSILFPEPQFERDATR